VKRLLRILGFSLVALIALVGAERVRETYLTPLHDLKEFDSAVVGRLDTDMWRSYYERRPILLFRLLTTLLHDQYGMPPLEAAVNAYRAAHAAFVFKDGKSRADYEKALPDLKRFYCSIAARSTEPFDYTQTATRELEWWIQHRERSPELARGLADLQAAIYHVPAESLAEHARLRAEAMVLRDDRATAITDEDWRKIGSMLDESWRDLHAAVTQRATESLRSQDSPSAGR
jgi:hypothetical protein